MRKVIVSDRMLHEAGSIPSAMSVGEHDPADARPHHHYSIFTLKGKDGNEKVGNVDWGYHKKQDAKAVLDQDAQKAESAKPNKEGSGGKAEKGAKKGTKKGEKKGGSKEK